MTYRSAPGGIRSFRVWWRLNTAGNFRGGTCRSGMPELDALLGGGITAGSSTLVIGPAGTGKSLLGLNYVPLRWPAANGRRMFVFDEEIGLLIDRAKMLGIDLQAMRNRAS